LLLMGLAPTPFSAICFVAAILAGIGMAGSIAGANTLALDVAPITQMGTVMAGMNTMQPIGILFFLILGGYLYDIVSPGSAFLLKGGANLALFIVLVAVKGGVTREITPVFTMDWEPAAKQQMMKIPGSVRQGAIEGAEAYAKDQNVTKITAEFCQNLRKMMEGGS
jgi:MFS family permease